MISDIVRSVKFNLTERMASPLLGTFLVSWSIWNYKLFIIIFSSLEPIAKIEIIEKFIRENIYISLWYPILTTLFFIFLYPYPSRFVFWFWRNQQKELIKIRQKIEDETPLTAEESKTIRREIVDLRLEMEKEINTRDEQIKRLKELLQQKEQKEISEPKQGLVDNEITEEQVLILETFIKSGKPSMHINEIEKYIKIKRVRLEYNLDKLLEWNFLEKSVSYDSGEYYSLLAKAREFLVKMGLT